MKFSILIAHYNNWNYFQECYKSIQDQTYQDFEIVIVDDCSTDDSFQKLEELSLIDSKIKLFQNKENKQVGYTKRRCIEEATGEVCGFLDPDDLLHVNALEKSIKAYHKNKKGIATYSKLELIDEESNSKGPFFNTKNVKNNNKLFFNINFEIAHFFTFKREFYLKTTGINNSLIIGEDQDLYLKLYELGDFIFIDDFLYQYRLHDKGISQNKGKTKRQKENWNQVILDACKRRNIIKLYGKDILLIDDLPKFLFQKENTLFNRVKRKLKW